MFFTFTAFTQWNTIIQLLFEDNCIAQSAISYVALWVYLNQNVIQLFRAVLNM